MDIQLDGPLAQRLNLSGLDQAELELLLQWHFGGAQSTDSRSVVYTNSETKADALTLSYAHNGRLQAIAAGPALTESDIASLRAAIDDKLRNQQPVHFGQVALFAQLPTTGVFRYRDVFQLVPMPPEAPRPEFAMGPHPLLLQFSVQGSTDYHIAMQRRARRSKELELLLMPTVFGLMGGQPMTTVHRWSVVQMPQPVGMTSVLAPEGYTWSGANGIITEFSNLGGFHPIAREPSAAYYRQLGISPGTPLKLSADMEMLLDRYFDLPEVQAVRFQRACHWYSFAQRAAPYSRSGAFNALVSSIEALVPDPGKGTRCDACKRPTGVGRSRLFMEFLEHFAPGDGITSSLRRSLYDIRSAIAHGGTLLHDDRRYWMQAMTGSSLEDWSKFNALWTIVRVSLVNWLSEQPITP